LKTKYCNCKNRYKTHPEVVLLSQNNSSAPRLCKRATPFFTKVTVGPEGRTEVAM